MPVDRQFDHEAVPQGDEDKEDESGTMSPNGVLSTILKVASFFSSLEAL